MTSAFVGLAILLLAQSKEPPDLDRLQGTWHLVSAITDGEPWIDDEFLKEVDVRSTFKGKKLDVQGNFQGFGGPGHEPDDFEIDPKKTPKTLDRENRRFVGGWLGIYEFKGKHLRVCERQNDLGPRPKSFQAPKGSKAWLMVLEKR